MNVIRRYFSIALLSLSTVLLFACSAPEGTLISDCVDEGELHVVCGMQSPEDIAIVPGGDYLLLSELGSMGSRSGRLLSFKIDDESWQSVYPLPNSAAPENLQGDADCSEPPGAELSPHGTHLVQLTDGSWRYLVVNHGGREAVELFRLQRAANGAPELEWQGCVFPADNTLINDVVGLSNGEVVYSRMFHPDDFMGQARGLLGMTTGDVWHWSPATGPRLLPNTSGSLTNGLEISPGEKYVFINQYMNREVHKYELAAEKVVGVGHVPNVDNSAWGPDGELWLASQSSDIASFVACTRDVTVTCGMAFEIVALDPDTMQSRVVFQHQGPPMGAATVATPHGDKVYIGSYLGDRLLIVPLSEFSL